MRLFRIMLASLAILSLTVTAYGSQKADDKKAGDANKEKIVGLWETKEGHTIEFTKDGKVKMLAKVKDKSFNVDGTYSVDGDKVTIGFKFDDKEKKQTATIKKLDDKELTTVDTQGNEDTLKRKK